MARLATEYIHGALPTCPEEHCGALTADEATVTYKIESRYRIDDALATPRPESIAIVDDVLTTGAHFRAASSLLPARFPTVEIVGLFIARRVPDADDVT